MESIFRNVDEDKTIENAEQVLKDYWRWRYKAKRVDFNLQSPAMDGMPKAQSFENTAERKHVNKSNASFMANLVVNVINSLTIDEGTEKYTAVLNLFYIKRYTKTHCMNEMQISDKTFDKYLREAQLIFAEMYPDAVQDLIVRKYEPEKKHSFKFE